MNIKMIVFIIASAVLCALFLALFLLRLALRVEDFSAKTRAALKEKKYKKNDWYLGKENRYSPTKIYTVKNTTKGVYEYCVNGRIYKKQYTKYVTGKQMPIFVSVTFLKIFPKVSRIDEEIFDTKILCYGSICAFLLIIVLSASLTAAFFGLTLIKPPS